MSYYCDKGFPPENLNDKQRRMLKDDDYFDVTAEEVRSFFKRLNRLGFPKELILKMRRKYDDFIDDGIKQTRLRLGISADEEYRVTYDFIRNKCLIDGLTEIQWRMLNDKSYVPCKVAFSSILTSMRAAGKRKEADLIEAKYGDIFLESERRILRNNGLPEDTLYEDIDKNHIDGLTFMEWKLLYMPDFDAPKGYIRATLRKFEKRGDAELAAALYSKYAEFLDEKRPEPALSLAEAKAVLDGFRIQL